MNNLEVGDVVRITSTEGRSSYARILGRQGHIVNIESHEYRGTKYYRYYINITGFKNENQEGGLYVFERSKSLKLIAKKVVGDDAVDEKSLFKYFNEQAVERVLSVADTYKTDKKIVLNSIFGRPVFNPTDMYPVAAMTAAYTELKNIKNSEENKMNNEQHIIDIWYNNKRRAIEDTRHKHIKIVYENSVLGTAVNTFLSTLNVLMTDKNERKPQFHDLFNEKYLTKLELESIDKINDTANSKLAKLEHTCEECNAILMTCETFDQKMTVLQNYDIVDSNYKIKSR